MKEYINGLMKMPGKQVRKVLIKNDLKTLQSIVGGYIEVYPLPGNGVVICNEEGKLQNLPINVVINGEVFVGTILIVGTDGEDFDSLHGYRIRCGSMRYYNDGEIESVDTLEVIKK